MAQLFTRYAAILALGVLQPSNAITQPAAARERVIVEQPGVPLASRLLPSDEVVIVKVAEHGAVFDPKPTAAQMLQYNTDTSDVSLIVDVVTVSGVLSADQSSIATRIDGTVVDVVLARKRSVRAGQPIQIGYAGGGELTIGKIFVRFGAYLSVAPGRYLLFLRAAEDGTWYPTATPLLVRDDRVFNSVVDRVGGSAPVHDIPLAEVVQQVRRFGKTPK
jgi:hypothetical protein